MKAASSSLQASKTTLEAEHKEQKDLVASLEEQLQRQKQLTDAEAESKADVERKLQEVQASELALRNELDAKMAVEPESKDDVSTDVAERKSDPEKNQEKDRCGIANTFPFCLCHLSPTCFPLVSHLFPTCLLLVSRLFPYYCLLVVSYLSPTFSPLIARFLAFVSRLSPTLPLLVPHFSTCLPLPPFSPTLQLLSHLSPLVSHLSLTRLRLVSQLLSPTCLPLKNCLHWSPTCFSPLFHRWKLLLDAHYSQKNLALESAHPEIRNFHSCWVAKLDLICVPW